MLTKKEIQAAAFQDTGGIMYFSLSPALQTVWQEPVPEIRISLWRHQV